jgi:hypothetical protein
MGLIEEIAAERPFSGYCTITTVQPIIASNARSGETAFVDSNRGWFKIRRCKNGEEAQRIENNVRRFAHIFPKFYGRDGQYLLFEKLVGYRNFTHDELLANMYKIGRIYGEIHEFGEASQHDQRKFFLKRLDCIKDAGIIDETLYRDTLAAFERSLTRVGDHISLELNDVHPGNFMVNEQGEFLYVDEEGLDYRVKGIGIGKFIQNIDWRAWQEFLRGYNEVHDGSYLTNEYLHHIRILEPVRSIFTKMRAPDKADAIKQELESLRRAIR